MDHQFNSMSDAQLQAKLVAAGFPVLPITATTRPLLMKKLQSGLASKNCQGTPKYYTMVDRVYSMSDAQLQKALVELGYRVMPVTATTRKVLLKKLISIYDGTSTTRKTAASTSNKEFCFNPSNTTLSHFDYKFAPNLSSLKFSITESDTNIFNNDKKGTTNEIFGPVDHEANPLLFMKATPATLDQLPLKSVDSIKNNMDDYEKNIMQMFQTFSSQQDKRFREMLTNINTTRQDMFQNLSNQQEVRFRELLTDLNCARQEIYQTVSNQQEKLIKELLTSLNSSKQDMFQTLSNQQEKRFKDLLISFQSTREDMCQLVHDQRENQFEELLSNVNHITMEKDELAKTVDNLSSKYGQVLLQLQKIDSEKKEDEKQIQILHKKLEILERRLSLSTMILRNIPKVNNHDFETKEDLCEFVIKLGKSVGIHIEVSNIRDVYRENYEGSSALIVEFTTVLTKEALMSALKKILKEKYKREQLNTTLDYFQTPTSFLLLSFFVLIFSFYFLSVFLICYY